jgi:hypothetical protein
MKTPKRITTAFTVKTPLFIDLTADEENRSIVDDEIEEIDARDFLGSKVFSEHGSVRPRLTVSIVPAEQHEGSSCRSSTISDDTEACNQQESWDRGCADNTSSYKDVYSVYPRRL